MGVPLFICNSSIMKRLGILSLFLLFVFSLHYAAHKQEVPVEKVKAYYVSGLENFHSNLKDFQKAIPEARAGRLSRAQLQQSFSNLRISYKRIEFLLDYLQPQDVKDHLNGAPLPKTERNAPRLIVLEPKGMQKMEELLYDPLLAEQWKELQALTKSMDYQLSPIIAFAKRSPISDRQVFEAVRIGLVRIMAMGITGFDTPASSNAIRESAVAWESLAIGLEPYRQKLGNTNLAEELASKWSAGLKVLKAAVDFDSFDRLHFIRDYVEPLYALSLDLHLKLGYETAQEVYRGQLPFNYRASSIFSEDFFNLQYYTGLKPDAHLAAKARLGRMLFFEPALSANFERSCASCHDPKKAFADGRAKSLAFDQQGTVDRNAPSLYNALYAEKFFHDLRADRMEAQMEHVIFNEKEFATNYHTIFARLESSAEYRRMFKEAFPDFNGAINRHSLSEAIVAYLSNLKSFNSPVDRYLRGEEVVLSEEVIKGFNLFTGKAACATCHFAPSFSGLVPPWFEENESEVLGVLSQPLAKELDPDWGRYKNGVLQDEAPFYKHSFKTPTVRNVAYTAPYFHNGAYPDLASVLEFYNHGGALGLGLELPNQTLPADSLGLDSAELKALEAFMEALSDTTNRGAYPLNLPQLLGRPQHLIGGKY